MTSKQVKNILFVAPMLTKSGYGVHARQVLKWLFKREDTKGDIKVFCNPTKWGINPWIVDSEYDNGLVHRIAHASSIPPGTKFDVSYQLLLPNEWNPQLAEKNIGITAGVEADKCNPTWIEACNKMSGIIVPSEFTKHTLKSSGDIKVNIDVIPEAYPEAFDDDSIGSFDLELKTDFNFLVLGQFTGNNPDNDRKNLPYTIKWLYEAFAGNSNVGFVIKTNSGRLTKADSYRTESALSHIVSQVAGGKSNGPKFYMLHGDMSDAELKGLYTNPKIKAIVSFTRGEGFGLPLLEAARCGLPVIATGWSAHTEFLGLGKYSKVDYLLSEIHPTRVDGNIWIEGAKWAQPSESDAKRRLKKFYESSSIPFEWAEDLKGKIKEKYNLSAIMEQYDQHFEAMNHGENDEQL